MFKEVTEQELMKEIGSGKKIVLDVWMDNCPHCDAFAPIFEEVSNEYSDYEFLKFKLNNAQAGSSKFKNIYMKVEKGQKSGAPAIYIFEDSKNKLRHHGRVDAATLRQMIAGDYKEPAVNVEKSYKITQAQALQLEGMLGEIPTKFGFNIATFLKQIFLPQETAEVKN